MSERERLRGILLDMDGVLYTADNIISGAVETAAWVRAQGIPHLFVTNTTSKSRAALAEKLLSFGIPTQETEILTPAAAAAEWLHAQGASGIALFVPPSARLEFADLPCLPDDAERAPPTWWWAISPICGIIEPLTEPFASYITTRMHNSLHWA